MQGKKQISIIVAIDDNYGIGKDNKLLCHLTNDLKRFKQITSGSTVVMGKNTYFSLPKRPLPNRKNIVISDDTNDHFEGCTTVYSIDEAIEKMDTDKENFIMGGASIYRQFFPFADKLYITKIHAAFDADTFFPEISQDEWALIDGSETYTDPNNNRNYSYLIFHRK